MMKAYQQKDQGMIQELQQSERGKARMSADKKFLNIVDSIYYQTVMANKDSFWGPLMMISFTSYLSEDMKPWYEALSPSAKQSYYGQKVKEELYPAGKEGTKVPEFTVKDKNGNDVTLSTLRQGKEKGFEIVSISIDKKKEEWEKALKEEQLAWPNFLDETGVASLYKVRFVPTTYLIDSEGVMIGENILGEELANRLKELLQ